MKHHNTIIHWRNWATLLCLSLFFSACSVEDILREAGKPEKEDDTESLLPRGFRDQFADVNGITMHYVIGGQGDPIVLVHGWPQTWYEWNRIMPELAENYTVIVPDLRGGGLSDKPAAGENGYTKSLLAEDLHQLVQQLGYSSIKLVGHDIGGMASYAYASLYPDEVEKLVIMDVPLPGIEPYWTTISQNPRAWHFAFHQEEGAVDAVIGNEEAYITDFIEGQAYNFEAFTEQELDVFVAAYTGRKALRGGFEWYRGFPTDIEENQQFSQTLLTMPVLGMGGEFSAGPIIGPMINLIADSTQTQSVVLPETGHWLVEEQPEAVLEALLQFFTETESNS